MFLIFGFFSIDDVFPVPLPDIISEKFFFAKELFLNNSYFGFIEMEDSTFFKGALIDKAGDADISGTIFDGNLVFTKKYLHKDEERVYNFKKDGEYYLELCKNKEEKNIINKCFLVKIDKIFFKPDFFKHFY